MPAHALSAEDGAMNRAQHVLTDGGAESWSSAGQAGEEKLAQRKRSLPARIGRGLLGLAGVVVVLGLSGAVYESVAEATDARAYPPPGQMVDVGGYRLHINCIGTGSPTVVIEAGWGDSSGAWSSWVQSPAATTTRVCTYDRAGMGYSESGPLPRTAERFARELHALLSSAGEPGPYVLVGHSMGGLAVRVFAHEYAADTAGVVLIESMSPSAAKGSNSEGTAESKSHSFTDWALTLPARTGLLRLLSGPLDAYHGLSPEQATAYSSFSITPRSFQAWLDEGKGMRQSLAQAGAVTSFGDLPLVVLSRGLTVEPDQDWQRMQTELLGLSSISQQLFATESGHNVEIDQPQAAVGAIEMMVSMARGGIS
jgi:pimeloyl-ACP methyl ester carboxylesterase